MWINTNLNMVKVLSFIVWLSIVHDLLLPKGKEIKLSYKRDKHSDNNIGEMNEHEF